MHTLALFVSLFSFPRLTAGGQPYGTLRLTDFGACLRVED